MYCRCFIVPVATGGRREQMSVPPPGTVTFLFTDIEGSTKVWERNPQAMHAALVRHDEDPDHPVATDRSQVEKEPWEWEEGRLHGREEQA